MKFFHKKFLNQQASFRSGSENITNPIKVKFSYLLNQILIWGFIVFVIFYILKFAIVP